MYTTILNKLLEQNDVLVACHQGSAGGNIAYNTYRSMLNAINQGAHIVEVDICKSKDDVFYIFHEHEEPIRINRNTNFREFTSEEISRLKLLNMNMAGVEPPNTLRDFMENMSKHPETLIHIDHAYKWGVELLQALDIFEKQRETIIIKTHAFSEESLLALSTHPIKYMTMIKIWDQDQFDKIENLTQNINVVGYEMCFSDKEAGYVKKSVLSKLRKQGYHTMVNALVLSNDWPSVCAGFDDDISLLDNPDKGWGVLYDMGFDIIQTDWPIQLQHYLHKQSLTRNY